MRSGHCAAHERSRSTWPGDERTLSSLSTFSAWSTATAVCEHGDMGPRRICIKDVDVAVEKGGAGGETKAPGGYVDRGLETMAVWDRLLIEVTPGSATSWDRPVDRSYLVRVRRDEFSVVVGWGLSRRSAESIAERLIELLGPASPVPGRPAA